MVRKQVQCRLSPLYIVLMSERMPSVYTAHPCQQVTMTLQNKGFAVGKLGPGSCFSSPLMVRISPDAPAAEKNNRIYQLVDSILQENLREGPGKVKNPLYEDFLALVEQPFRLQTVFGYPVVDMAALPAVHDARDRGPRHTDALPPMCFWTKPWLWL